MKLLKTVCKYGCREKVAHVITVPAAVYDREAEPKRRDNLESSEDEIFEACVWSNTEKQVEKMNKCVVGVELRHHRIKGESELAN